LTGFFVAFFFAIVLFSFGLDLAVLAAGFFIAGIRYSPIRSLLLGERRTFGWVKEPISLVHYRNALWRIQEISSMFIKKF
jgi:hypothetical protein